MTPLYEKEHVDDQRQSERVRQQEDLMVMTTFALERVNELQLHTDHLELKIKTTELNNADGLRELKKV